MRENTKYHSHRFVGKINIEEVEPWFDFATMKPWEDTEIPWMLENKVRRQILLTLAKKSMNLEEVFDRLKFSPQPLLISEDEYKPNVNYQWTIKTVENHLQNLEWYNLIKKDSEKYELTFPVLKMDTQNSIEKYIDKFAYNWITIIKELKSEINTELSDINEKTPLYAILVEKAVEKLYTLLKGEGLIPKEPANVKALWVEQLRNIKFEEWVKNNF